MENNRGRELTENHGVIELADGNKPSNTTRYRVKEVAKRIAKGKTRDYCLDFIQETYKLSEQQSIKIYNSAMKYLIPTEPEQQEMIRAKLYARYEDLYEQAIEAKNFKVAREVLDSEAKIAGLVSGTKIGVKTENEEIVIAFD